MGIRKSIEMKRISFLAALIFLPAAGMAQLPDDSGLDRLTEQILSELSVQGEEEMDFSEITEDLYLLRQEPLNLNRATEEELQRLYFLEPVQVEAILEHRRRYGSFKSIYELRLLYGWTLERARQAALFVYVGPASEREPDWRYLLKSGTHELMARYRERFPHAAGFKNGNYAGSPQAYYLRYRYSVKSRYSIGWVADKDAGEAFFKGSQKQGFDFYSAHIYARPGKGIVKAFVIGDYRIQVGQGLACWTGFPAGSASFMKNGRGLLVSNSASESLYLRGGAVHLSPHRRWDIILFGSYKGRDAGLEEDSLAQSVFVYTFPAGGLHRTASEIAAKGAVKELLTGALLQYRGQRFRTGLSIQYTGLSVPVYNHDKPYKLYRFSGKRLLNASFFYMLKTHAGMLAGEWALSSNGGWACLNSWQGNLSSLFRLALVQRYYSPRYTAFYTAAMQRYPQGSGETGIGMALQCFPAPKIELDIGADAAYASWITYTQPFLSYTGMAAVSLLWKPVPRTEFGLRGRYLFRQEKNKLPAPVTTAADTRKWDFRMQFIAEPSARIRLQTRADMVLYYRTDTENPARGYMLSQDLVWQPVPGILSLSFRYSLFHVTDYNARIYAYERDVQAAFSVPAIQGKGQRLYLTTHVKAAEFLDIYAKIACTYNTGGQGMGSGNTATVGSSRWDLGLQTRWKWKNALGRGRGRPGQSSRVRPS